ncbi:MAG: hypothetical protein RTU92_00360 [Candidatus Thorarchaeota archaeon]
MFKDIRRFSKIKKTHYTLDDFFKLFTITLRRQFTQRKPYPDTVPFTETVRVELVGWKDMYGEGMTVEEAYGNLEKSFMDYSENNESTPEPIDFMIGSVYEERSDWWKQVGALASDFLPRIVGHKYEDCYITVYSDVYDFVASKEWDEIPIRIQSEYGVDISDIEDGNLLRIFDKIILRSSIWHSMYSSEVVES